MLHEYKMVQIPPTIALQTKEKGNEAALYLEQLTNKMAKEGWEFYRVDPVGIYTPGGCLGGQGQTSQYNVVTFRRAAQPAPRTDSES